MLGDFRYQNIYYRAQKKSDSPTIISPLKIIHRPLFFTKTVKLHKRQDSFLMSCYSLLSRTAEVIRVKISLFDIFNLVVGTVSVAALPVVVGREPSQCGRPPRVTFSLP